MRPTISAKRSPRLARHMSRPAVSRSSCSVRFSGLTVELNGPMRFASRDRLGDREFTMRSPGVRSTGVLGFIENAVGAVERADLELVALQECSIAIEVGDVNLRAGASEVRQLIDGLRSCPLLRTLARAITTPQRTFWFGTRQETLRRRDRNHANASVHSHTQWTGYRTTPRSRRPDRRGLRRSHPTRTTAFLAATLAFIESPDAPHQWKARAGSSGARLA